MRRVRFLLDAHVHSAIASGLRRRNIEVATCQELRLDRLPDDAIIRFAAANGWVVFTQGDDFLSLCNEDKTVHQGLIYSHQRNPIGRIIAGLALIYECLSPDEMAGHIEFI